VGAAELTVGAERTLEAMVRTVVVELVPEVVEAVVAVVRLARRDQGRRVVLRLMLRSRRQPMGTSQSRVP
jgi:transcription antitermination factor NusA-like protein